MSNRDPYSDCKWDFFDSSFINAFMRASRDAAGLGYDQEAIAAASCAD